MLFNLISEKVVREMNVSEWVDDLGRLTIGLIANVDNIIILENDLETINIYWENTYGSRQNRGIDR